jgi:lytic murein transglycosylase
MWRMIFAIYEGTPLMTLPRFFFSAALLLAAAVGVGTEAQAQTVPCGGSFKSFIKDLKSEALAKGHTRASVDKFFKTAAIDKKVLQRDRAQGVFRQTFTEFAKRSVSGYRMTNGAKNAKKYADVFESARRKYGVDPAVLLSFWALETDFGAVQGDFNTLNALITLSYDCRRPELFRPQIFAALTLAEQGDFDPVKTVGAWAGEIGMIQMLPEDILNRGIDGDGDGHVRLKTSVPDALMTGARLLRDLGWRANEPWLIEIRVPAGLDWSKTGLNQQMPVSGWAKLGIKPRTGKLPPGGMPASVLLPQGRKGPAFLALPNFFVYFEWNKSFVYVTTAAYFATRLAGAPRVTLGNPDPVLSDARMKDLQRKLKARGYDVGKVDGILGAKTRPAVQAEQKRLGLPADAWPTQALLDRL